MEGTKSNTQRIHSILIFYFYFSSFFLSISCRASNIEERKKRLSLLYNGQNIDDALMLEKDERQQYTRDALMKDEKRESFLFKKTQSAFYYRITQKSPLLLNSRTLKDCKINNKLQCLIKWELDALHRSTMKFHILWLEGRR